jgi:hypothetical protein
LVFYGKAAKTRIIVALWPCYAMRVARQDAMDDFNLRIHSRDFDTLLDIAREGNPEIDADYLRRAYELA